jgi:hypothetical protein
MRPGTAATRKNCGPACPRCGLRLAGDGAIEVDAVVDVARTGAVVGSAAPRTLARPERRLRAWCGP